MFSHAKVNFAFLCLLDLLIFALVATGSIGMGLGIAVALAGTIGFHLWCLWARGQEERHEQ